MEFIELTHNNQKMIKSLKKKSDRDELGLFLTEGEKICSELLNQTEYETEFIVISSNAGDSILKTSMDFNKKGIPVFRTNNKSFENLCDTKTPQGILAVVKFREFEPLKNEPFIALDCVSDPGNLGTIIRTAEWFGFKQIVLGEGTADIFNPKTIRSTMGSFLRMIILKTASIPDFIRNNFSGHQIFGASSYGEINFNDINFIKHTGIILGNESHGLSDSIRSIISKNIKIQGFGSAESLNVSVAAGIIMYKFSQKLNNKI